MFLDFGLMNNNKENFKFKGFLTKQHSYYTFISFSIVVFIK